MRAARGLSFVVAAAVVAQAAAVAPARADDDEPAEESIDDVVARSLYERGLDLFHAGRFADARQILVEAYARSPRGPYAPLARDLVRKCDAKLGRAITAFPDPGDGAPADPYADDGSGGGGAPLEDPYGPPVSSGDAGLVDPYAWSEDGSVPEDPYAGGVDADELEPVSPTRGRFAGDDRAADPARLRGGRTEGERDSVKQSATLAGVGWGFGYGLLAAHVFDDPNSTGSDDDQPGADYILWGATGAALGMGAGLLYARAKPSSEDLGVVQAAGGAGLAGGLILGVAMAPAQERAYSLNGLIGGFGGMGVGLWLADEYEVPAARTKRIALWSAAGGVAPWLIWALAGASGGEQAAAGFSLVGMGVGGYVGWRRTRHLRAPAPAAEEADVEMEREGGALPADPYDSDSDGAGDGDAAAGDDDLATLPPALVGRTARGRWLLGAPLPRAFLVAPSAADPTTRVGFGVDLVAGSF